MMSQKRLRLRPLIAFLTIACLSCSGAGEGDDAEAGSAGSSNGTVAHAGESSESAAADYGEEAADSNELLERARQPFLGDLPEIRERRLLRALVSYGKTNFFHGGGRARGFEVEMFNKYSDFLNEDVKSTLDRVRIVFVPTPFDRLLSDLTEGRGDVAAAGLTVTSEREKEAAFTQPYLANVREVVVTGRGAVHLSRGRERQRCQGC